MTDRRIPLVVTYGLVLICVVGLLAVIACTLTSNPVPDVIGNVTSASLGGLTALLASTRSEPGPV